MLSSHPLVGSGAGGVSTSGGGSGEFIFSGSSLFRLLSFTLVGVDILLIPPPNGARPVQGFPHLAIALLRPHSTRLGYLPVPTGHILMGTGAGGVPISGGGSGEFILFGS